MCCHQAFTLPSSTNAGILVSLSTDVLIWPPSIHYTGTFDPDKVGKYTVPIQRTSQSDTCRGTGFFASPLCCSRHLGVEGTVATKPCGCTSYKRPLGQRVEIQADHRCSVILGYPSHARPLFSTLGFPPFQGPFLGSGAINLVYIFLTADFAFETKNLPTRQGY